MGCAATKSQSSNVVEPMPSKPDSLDKDENNNKKSTPKRSVKTPVKQGEKDSLRGSNTSLHSENSATRSDRESSAQSTRTTDSGFSGGDCGAFISENSSIELQKRANVENRPETPELVIEGSQVPRRQSGKDKRQLVHVNSLPPITGQSLIERPQSRAGNLAFEIVLTPNTGNIKKKPSQLPSLEKRHNKKARMSREELEEKLKRAEERRRNHEQNVVTRSQSMRGHQLRSALQYAKSQPVTEEDNDF